MARQVFELVLVIFPEEEQLEFREDDAVLNGSLDFYEVHELLFHNRVGILIFSAVLKLFDDGRMVDHSCSEEDADKVRPVSWPIIETLKRRRVWIQVGEADLRTDDLQADFAVQLEQHSRARKNLMNEVPIPVRLGRVLQQIRYPPHDRCG